MEKPAARTLALAQRDAGRLLVSRPRPVLESASDLGQDPEINHTVGGQAVANLRLATSRIWKDKDTGERKQDTEWHDVVVWGKQAEACGEHLSKGRLVYIEGRLKTEKWQDKQTGQDRYRVKIVAESVRFLGGGNRADDPQPSDDPE